MKFYLTRNSIILSK